MPQHLRCHVRAEPHAHHAGQEQARGLAARPHGAGRQHRHAQRPLRLGPHHAGVEIRGHEAARPLQALGHVLRADVLLHVRAQAPLRVARAGGPAAEQVPLERVVRPGQDARLEPRARRRRRRPLPQHHPRGALDAAVPEQRPRREGKVDALLGAAEALQPAGLDAVPEVPEPPPQLPLLRAGPVPLPLARVLHDSAHDEALRIRRVRGEPVRPADIRGGARLQHPQQADRGGRLGALPLSGRREAPAPDQGGSLRRPARAGDEAGRREARPCRVQGAEGVRAAAEVQRPWLPKTLAPADGAEQEAQGAG
mmetsp:Transcript_78103/g.252840  ORF Transcript_78103/g.252840 Transcript_78103/m.252840 type:complete len:310 (+) Transcript_78103:382-1311(+)